MKLSMLFLLLIQLLSSNVLSAQKYEREYRIKSGEVPSEARQFVEDLDFDRNIRWYMEEGLDQRSVEAKTKYQGYRYSIEFDTTGQLQDIEVEVEWKALPTEKLQAICSQLSEDFDKFKIVKIQVQYSGNQEVLQQLTTDSFDTDSAEVKYELIVKGAEPGEVNWYEYLFSDAGTLEHRTVIVFRNTDNLEY